MIFALLRGGDGDVIIESPREGRPEQTYGSGVDLRRQRHHLNLARGDQKGFAKAVRTIMCVLRATECLRSNAGRKSQDLLLRMCVGNT